MISKTFEVVMFTALIRIMIFKPTRFRPPGIATSELNNSASETPRPLAGAGMLDELKTPDQFSRVRPRLLR
jgi:hypothetical protein